MADGQQGIPISSGFTLSEDDFVDKDFIQSALANALAKIPAERRYNGKPIYVLEPANRGLYFMNITKDGFVKSSSVAQANLTAIVPPDATNDSSEGYAISSLWLDTVANEYYRCSDATAGTAVWPKTTLTADELATVAVSGQYADLLGLPDLSTLPAISQTLNFIDLETFYFTQGQDYKLTSVIEQAGLTIAIKLGGTATDYILGDTVTAFDVLDITVNVVGAVTIKGTLL